MSRLNFNLRNIADALSHIQSILIKKKVVQKASSFYQQTTADQKNSKINYTTSIEFSNETNILKDFILYSNTLINENKNNQTALSLSSLPVPLINNHNLKLNLYPGDSFKLRFGQILVNNDADLDYLKEPLSQKERDLITSLNNVTLNSTNNNQIRDTKQKINEMWFKFEQTLYALTFRGLFKPHLTYFDQTTDNKQMPKVVVNETLAIMFDMRNHLKINLIISDVTLLWKYESDDSTSIVETNELTNTNAESIVECSTLRELNLAAYETYKLRLHLVPKRSKGTLTVLGIKYRLGLASFLNNSSVVSISNILSLSNQLTGTNISDSSNNSQETNPNTLFGKQLFELKGPRLNNNQTNMRSVVYDTDQRLNFKILNQMPLLQVSI
jgi:trafficking protein particle complex subunit 8